jgi:hypothetical protein
MKNCRYDVHMTEGSPVVLSPFLSVKTADRQGIYVRIAKESPSDLLAYGLTCRAPAKNRRKTNKEILIKKST